MSRTEITYDLIKPLVVSEEVDGRQVHCQFAIPGSDEIFEASASVQRSRDVGSVVKKQVTRSVMNEVRRGLGSMLRGIFGGGIIGRTARTVVNSSTRDQSRSIMNAPSAIEKSNAVVSAFKRVAANFSYDDATGSWAKPSATNAAAISTPVEQSAFEAQLTKNPVNTKYGKSILARVLAHIAYADGELAEEEAEFFKSSIPAEFGDVTELGKSEQISAIEAEELNEGMRETILMLAWTISSVDMDVAAEEEAMLNSYGTKFGINADRQQELSTLGRVNVLEGFMSVDMTREELFELAGKLRLSNDDAERAKIRWTKRQ